MNRFRFHHGARPALLLHAVQVVYRANPSTEWMSFRDGCGDVGLRQQNRFRQTTIQSEMTGHCCGKRAASSMCRVRALSFRLENFLLDSSLRLEAQ